MILQEEADGKDVTLQLRKCKRCRDNYIEMFKVGINNQPSYDTLIANILRDKNLTLDFTDLKITCPQCQETMKDITYIQLDEKDLELLNKTKLKDVWITMESI